MKEFNLEMAKARKVCHNINHNDKLFIEPQKTGCYGILGKTTIIYNSPDLVTNRFGEQIVELY